jgi:hypothetical protein
MLYICAESVCFSTHMITTGFSCSSFNLREETTDNRSFARLVQATDIKFLEFLVHPTLFILPRGLTAAEWKKEVTFQQATS